MRLAPVALVVVLGGAAVVLAQPAVPVMVAIAEGTRLQPIARLAGDQWMPVASDALARAPRQWTRATDGRVLSVQPASPAPAGCAAPATMRVTGQDAPQSRQTPAPALATTGAVRRTGLVRLSSRSPTWATVAALVAPMFEGRARGHGVSPAALASVPVTLDALFTTGSAAGAMYYFEASKRLPDAGNTPEEDPQGIVRVAFSGWLRQSADSLSPAGTKTELHWEPAETRPPVPGLAPLGVLEHGEESIWVMADSQRARRTFTLYAVRPSGVRTLFAVPAADC